MATHREVDHHGPQHAQIVVLRMVLADALHDDEVLQPGEQWTIPISVSCGFTGRVIVQVDQLGVCRPAPAEPPREEHEHAP